MTEENILCLAARTHPDDNVTKQLAAELQKHVHWERLWNLALLHEVWSLLDVNLRRLRAQVAIPELWLERSHRHFYATLLENAVLADQLSQILVALRSYGVPAIPVKGVVLTETLYGNLALRPAGDIDVLVRPQDLAAARQALNTLGFAQRANPDTGHLNHPLHDPPYFRRVAGQEVCVDLHWTLWAPHLFPLDIETVWKRLITTDFRGTEVHVLTPEDILLHLAIHLSRTSIRLRLICDIAELLRQYGATLDWDYLVQRAKSAGARTALYCSLATARNILDAPLPPDVLQCLGIGLLKRQMLAKLCDSDGLFNHKPRDGAARYPSFLERALLLDHGRQIIRALRSQTMANSRRYGLKRAKHDSREEN